MGPRELFRETSARAACHLTIALTPLSASWSMLWVTTLQIRLAFSRRTSSVAGNGKSRGSRWAAREWRAEPENHCSRSELTQPNPATHSSCLWFYSHLVSHRPSAAHIQRGEVPTQWHQSVFGHRQLHVFKEVLFVPQLNSSPFDYMFCWGG